MNKHLHFLSLLWLSMLMAFMTACSDDKNITDPAPEPEPPVEGQWTALTASPDTWDETKRADISYQLLLYSFADSDGDGYGDLNGVTQKLDYLNQLGVKALWLSPIHPCMSYHGYDVTDYTKVNPQLGRKRLRPSGYRSPQPRHQDLSGLRNEPHRHCPPVVHRS